MNERLGNTPPPIEATQPVQVVEQYAADGWDFGEPAAGPQTITPETYNDIPLNEVEAIGTVAVGGWEFSDTSAQESSFGEPAAPEHTKELREASVDGIRFQTNLPEGVWPFEPTEDGKEPLHPYRRPILPSTIDSLPVGEFSINNPETSDSHYNRTIKITEDADGKYINNIGGMGLVKNQGNTERLMTALGFKFDHQGLIPQTEAAPSPNTLQKKAAELGVDIQFFPDQKLIEGKDYLEAFVHDKFPISTASAEYYLHDSRDDHLTAVVLGGDVLKKALHDSAQQALEGGLDADVRAAGIDDFTAYLRGTISPTSNVHNPEKSYGFNTLLESGLSIGLSAETVRAVYDTTRKNAADWGLKLNAEPVSLQKAA